MKAKCIWLTALPCAGKTTIAKELLKYFPQSTLLDGDVIRDTPLAKDIGFTPEDRARHIMRMGTMAKMFVDAGVTTVCSFVSPSKSIREEVRSMFAPDDFVEVYLSTPVEECEHRDVKGMYAKARAGEIGNFTGVSASYEAPESPEVEMDTTNMTVQESVQKILDCVNPYDEKKSLFIGRWNGVMHRAHEALFESELKKGKNVLLLIRNVKPDEKNQWTAKEVKEMIDYRFKDNPKVESMIINDVEGVYYGRKVGYNVEQIHLDQELQFISGTKCREMIKAGDPKWKELVSPEIANFLENKYRK